MNVYDDHFRGVADLLQLAIDDVERVVARRHEHVPHHLHHRHVHSRRGLPDHASLAGIRLRIIRGANHVLVVLVIVDEILLVPDVIARGIGVDRKLRQLMHDRLGDAETARGVLDVDDREVDLLAIDDMIQLLMQRLAARLADDVTDVEDVDHFA